MANEKDLKKLKAEDMKNVDAGTVLAMRCERTNYNTHKKYYKYKYFIRGYNEEGGMIELNFSNLKDAIDADRKLFAEDNKMFHGGKVKVIKFGFQGPESREELLV